jgi:hypothetical protein
MTALAITLLRLTGAALNAFAALILFVLIFIVAQGEADRPQRVLPERPGLPFAPGADLLPVQGMQ